MHASHMHPRLDLAHLGCVSRFTTWVPMNVLSLEGAGCLLVIRTAELRGSNRVVLQDQRGCFVVHDTLRSPF